VAAPDASALTISGACRQHLWCRRAPTAVEVRTGQRDQIAIEHALIHESIQKMWNLFDALPPAVGTLLCQSLKNIRHRDDPRLGREALGTAPKRVAMAIERLMMEGRPFGDLLKARNMAQDLVGFEAVPLITENSSGVSGAGLSTISSGTHSLPTSCISPATSTSASASAGSPTCSPR
jgi:hypothetical protein